MLFAPLQAPRALAEKSGEEPEVLVATKEQQARPKKGKGKGSGVLLVAAGQQADTKTLQKLMCAPMQRGSCPDGPHWRSCRCSISEAPEEDPGDAGPTTSEDIAALNCMLHSCPRLHDIPRRLDVVRRPRQKKPSRCWSRRRHLEVEAVRSGRTASTATVIALRPTATQRPVPQPRRCGLGAAHGKHSRRRCASLREHFFGVGLAESCCCSRRQLARPKALLPEARREPLLPGSIPKEDIREVYTSSCVHVLAASKVVNTRRCDGSFALAKGQVLFRAASFKRRMRWRARPSCELRCRSLCPVAAPVDWKPPCRALSGAGLSEAYHRSQALGLASMSRTALPGTKKLCCVSRSPKHVESF